MEIVAMGMLICSLIFNGIFYVSEEVLFSKYVIDSFEIVGTEGLWGILIYSIILPIISTAACGDSLVSACIGDSNG